MICPPDIAASLLRKWLDEHAVLTVMLRGPRFSSTSGGCIIGFDDDGIEISALAVKSPSGEITAAPGSLLVCLDDASFEYVDARESPFDIRPEAESLFTCVMTIKLPDNLTLILTEMSDQPQPTSET